MAKKKAKQTKKLILLLTWGGVATLVIYFLLPYLVNILDQPRIQLPPGDGRGFLQCNGNIVELRFESGKIERVNTCPNGDSCTINIDGSATCGHSDSNTDSNTPTVTTCPYGTYLGQNDICFDYPGKNLPSLNYELCIRNAISDYYSRYGATTYTIAWITAKNVQEDQYISSDIQYKYVGCASVHDSNGGIISWAVTSDCKTGSSGSMLTNYDAANHNICGSDRLVG